MPKKVIEIRNLSKLYRLGEVGTGSIGSDLNRWWTTNVLKKEDPYSKVGQVNDRSKAAESDYVWALKDVDLDVYEGDVLGIIGANGAGKSTLLKLISRITSPTTGHIRAKGRIASLLEVGTGMHPDMTARENIYLNGSILGMTRSEINAKFDEIVDFAGVAMFVDTPVKRFSSGMSVRLGFAVAAFLEPEILIVDEVLAVGDAEFQKRAIGKMQDVTKGEGRTVLFVSHNMTSINALCDSCIVLKNGTINYAGLTSSSINFYLKAYSKNNNSSRNYTAKIGSEKGKITSVSISTNMEDNVQGLNEKLIIDFSIELKESLKNGALSYIIVDEMDRNIGHGWIFDSEKNIFRQKGVHILKCIIEKSRLYIGNYKLNVFLAEHSGNTLLDTVKNICPFSVQFINSDREYKWQKNTCTYIEDFYWQVDEP